MKVGDIYKSNHWGMVEVVEYKNSRNVIIKFAESGNEHKAQKDAIEKGLVKDVKRQMKETSLRYSEERLRTKVELEHKIALRKYKELLINLNNYIRSVHRTYRKQQKDREKLQSLQALIFTHPVFGDYRITDKDDKLYKILFIKTGYTSSCKLGNIQAGNVRDYIQYSKADQKLRERENSAKHYIENREVLLEKAKLWQRNNPEKARLRNRNRRARRAGAIGIHTKQDEDFLLLSQNNTCNSCEISLDFGKHLDHIVPLARGGSNDINNLQWLCPYCNNSKGAKTPEEWAAYVITPEFKYRRSTRELLDLF